MQEKIRQFFKGRYGADEFSKFLLVLTLISLILKMIFDNNLFYIIALISIIYANYRILSKNIYKRQAENKAYLSYKNKILGTITWTWLSIFGKAGYRYFKCEQCGQQLKVPKKKGKIRVTCPSCGNQNTTRS